MSSNKSIFHTLGDKIPLMSEYLNAFSEDYSEHRLYNYYSNLALNRFRWENLPQGLTSEIIEKQLFFHGMVCFTMDNNYGLICLPCGAEGFDLYGEPNLVRLTGNNYSKDVTLSNNINDTQGVLLKENDMRYPPVLHLLHYISLNSEIDKTVRMNLGQQRFPIILPKTSTTELSVKDLSNKVFNEYFPFQFVDKRMEKAMGENLEKIQALNTNVPFILNDLQDFKHDIEDELYTYLGLNNANTDKKERLIMDEVNANNGQIQFSLDISFKNREKVCQLINKKYGLNVSVRKVIEEIDEEMGGEDNCNQDIQSN